MAANDLLTKRKEPNFKAKEEDEDDEEGEDEEEEVELTTPVGEKKKVFQKRGALNWREREREKGHIRRSSVLLFTENAIKNTMV